MRYTYLFLGYIILTSCNSVKKTATREFENQAQHYTFNDKLSLLTQSKKIYFDNFAIEYTNNIQDSSIKNNPLQIKNLNYKISVQDTLHKNIGYNIFTSGMELAIHKSILKGLIKVDLSQTSTLEGFAQNKYNTADSINFYIRSYDNRSEPQPSSEIVGNKFRMIITPIINKKFSFLAKNSTKTEMDGYKIGYQHDPICFIDIKSGEVWLSSFNIHDDVKAFLLGLCTVIFLKNNTSL